MPCHCHSLSNCFNCVCGTDLRIKTSTIQDCLVKGRMKEIKHMASVLLVDVLRKILRKHYKQNPRSDFLCHFLSDEKHCSGPQGKDLLLTCLGGQWELDHNLLQGHDNCLLYLWEPSTPGSA